MKKVMKRKQVMIKVKEVTNKNLSTYYSFFGIADENSK